MSDSDDTDLLLLIPPDFFFVAPSPSPASSPSTLSPIPTPKSKFKKERPLTEELARKSLEEITSKLKVIDKRLSLIENQHSTDSMDGDRSSNWFDLDSNASGSARYRPPNSMEKALDRRPTNVQELIQATVRVPQSVMQRKLGPLTHSWGPSGRENQHHVTQRARSSSGRRDATALARAPHLEKDGSSDEEGELNTRERRSSSLPPTPSSHQLPKNIGDYSESMSCRPRSLYRELNQNTQDKGDTTSRLSSELERNSRQRAAEEMRGRSSATTSLAFGEGRFARLDFGNREEEESHVKKDGGRNSSKREAGLDWVDQRTSGEERSKCDHSQSIDTEGDESFNMNLSNLDGTLGVSAILPSLSSLGLGASVLQGSLDMTKESGTSTAGGLGGGLSLSEVERLLEDMHKTQMEMERSMRRGKAQLLNRRDDGQGSESKVDSSIGETDVREEDLSICKKGLVREEVQRREGWVMEGKSEGSHKQSKSSPVKIVVDGVSKKSQPTDKMDDFQRIAAKLSAEREQIEGLSVRDGPPIYRSKSDESLTGGQGKSSRSKTGAKYLGVDSSDDSLFSSGPLTTTNVTRLGDTLGSVPDLGLGVREMFANPEKRREPVKEPPFTKKKMSLLGCSNPTSSDTQALIAQGNNHRILESYEKPPSNEKTLECPQKGFSNAGKEAWPKIHFDKEGTSMSQTHGHGNSVDIGINPGENQSHPPQNVQRTPSLAPQKYLYSPQSLVENQENSGRDARRQMQLEQMKSKEPELNSQPGRDNVSTRPSVEDGGGVSSLDKVEEVADGASDQEDLVLPKPMGPVMVVGGEGRQRKRRKAGESDGFGWEGDRGCRQMKSDGIRAGMGQGGHWWNKGNGIGRNGRGAWNESRRKWATQDGGHRSLDDYLGQSRGRKFKDSGFHDDAAQSFPWDPANTGHRFLNESDMWDPPLAPGLTAAEEIITLRRKLEEERFRREHCERVIEEVGRRALESQERLAVCQGLGKAKDVALGKFREAWEEAVSGWKREAEARKSLEEEVDRYRDRVDAEIAFRDQRQKQLEAEMVRLGAESSSLREELRKGQREMADVTSRLSGMLETATKEVTATRKECESAVLKEARAQDAAAKAEEKAKDAMKKLNESNQRANTAEDEKGMMKQELETVQGKLRDCMSRVATLETRLADAEVATDHARQSEKKACEERMAAQQELEKERVNLKEFYQTQVEEVVKSKVKELQGQLDSIVLSLRKEAEMKEESAKRQGEERLKILSQKHFQEVSLLEQKHEEELALWSLRLKRAVSEAEKLRAWKSQLAKGMQSQLKEMSRFIAFGSEGVDNKSFSSPPKKPEKKITPVETSWRDVMASLNFHDSSDVIPEKDVIPKKDTDQDLGYSSMIKEKTEKEIACSGNKSSLPNSDLKKYIQMLLDREPGKPVNLIDIGSDSDEDLENRHTEVKQRQQVETKEVMKTTESENMNVKEHKASKKARRKEGGGTFVIKQSKDAHLQAMWEPMALKLSEPCSSGQLFEGEKCEVEGHRSRKPPWK